LRHAPIVVTFLPVPGVFGRFALGSTIFATHQIRSIRAGCDGVIGTSIHAAASEARATRKTAPQAAVSAATHRIGAARRHAETTTP
jgi:hypothetical protein